MGDLSFATQDLKAAMTLTNRVIERRNTIPVISQLRLDVLEEGKAQLRSTDLDIDVSVRFDVEGGYEGQAVMIPPERLSQIMRAGNGRMEISTSVRDETRITSGHVKARISRIIPAEDFPIQDEKGNWRDVECSEAELFRALSMVRPCIADLESRYYLNGVYLHPQSGMLRAVSTDGHMMAVCDTQIPWIKDYTAILPTKAVDILLATIRKDGNRTVQISARDLRMRFVIGDVCVHTKTIDGSYPDYHRVIPDFGEVVAIETSVTAAMVWSMTGSERSSLVTLHPDDGKITSRSPDGFEMEMPLSGRGDRIGFNARYLHQIAKVAGGTVRILSNGSREPGKLNGEDPDVFWIVMPMRVT